MRLYLLLPAFLAGCLAVGTSSFTQCDLDVLLDVDSAVAGEEITVSGRPLTEAVDTSIRVGGVDAQVVDVERVDCDACDSCRTTELCNVCEVCEVCEEFCATCQEVATFTVPDLEPGDAPVVVTNGYGASPTLPFDVVEGPSED